MSAAGGEGSGPQGPPGLDAPLAESDQPVRPAALSHPRAPVGTAHGPDRPRVEHSTAHPEQHSTPHTSRLVAADAHEDGTDVPAPAQHVRALARESSHTHTAHSGPAHAVQMQEGSPSKQARTALRQDVAAPTVSPARARSLGGAR